MLEPREFLGIAVDPVRLAVLGRAAIGPVDASHLAGELNVPERKVQEVIGKLSAAGLITDELTLDRDALRAIAQSLPQDAPIDAELIAQGWSEDEAQTLSKFFTGKRLKQIPTQRAKRRVVLERLAQEFEPGLRYQEKEVNFTLQLFHADYAALRRYLVDEEFLSRADGVYWRTGGRFPE
ncbi:MAG: DUF2087 domain-containing protein [Acidimicrobiia bacterium]|nr:DUF2087 domain-containing protein [Acidimicrobiia bacterium]MBT8215495.1 DUF2087 domain-containing protein [Acidimicrobiia bacterium]NNL69939.1 DUF2087 domain-containing protein [Acidimicrobiia bacterium]